MEPTQTLYTADEAAERLNLHVKTIRRYIREGKLKAKRIGKEYRITQADLDDFSGHRPLFDPPRTRHVLASCIVDVDAISREQSDRITTLLMAALNAGSAGDRTPRVDSIYYPERGRLRIAITADLALANELMRMVEALLERANG